jgi:acyl carrier protein
MSMKIDINDLIAKIEVEFETLEPGTLKPQSSFRELKDWSSMHALILIALVDTEYNVTLNGNDLRNLTTVTDLHALIESRMA